MGGHEEEVVCTVCYEAPKYPIAKPDKCEHLFCFICLKEWTKMRSACPLCMQEIKSIIKITANGRERRINVRQRSSSQFENNLDNDSLLDLDMDDITIMNARCVQCNSAVDDHLLLLCDGIVGYDVNEQPIQCNAAYHTYCTQDNLDEVPEGHWYCPFCRHTDELNSNVCSTFLSFISLIEAPSPSGYDTSNTSSEPDPSTNSEDDNHSSDKESRKSESMDSSSSISPEEMSYVLSSDEYVTEFQDENGTVVEDESHTSDIEVDESGELVYWNAADKFILNESSDLELEPVGRTRVVHCRNRRSTLNRSRQRQLNSGSRRQRVRSQQTDNTRIERRRRQTQGSSRRNGQSSSVNRALNRRSRRQRVRNGYQKVVRKRRRKKRVAKRKRNRRGATRFAVEQASSSKKENSVRSVVFKPPSLSILGEGYIEEPIDNWLEKKRKENSKLANHYQRRCNAPTEVDIVNSIMLEQVKTLAPVRYQRVTSSGSIIDGEGMAEYKAKINQEFNESAEAATSLKISNNLEDAKSDGKERNAKIYRKNRPSRWGTPTSDSNSHSVPRIPLPIGQPTGLSNLSIESIPVPSCASLPLHPTISSCFSHASVPSPITTPTTSLAMNSLSRSVNPFSLTSYVQPPPPLSHQHSLNLSQINNDIAQNQLFPMTTPLFPNLLMQPQLNLGVSNLLTGFLTNTAALSTQSQTNPFMLNQIHQQMQQQQNQLNQRIAAAGLASLQTTPANQQLTSLASIQNISNHVNALGTFQTVPASSPQLPNIVGPSETTVATVTRQKVNSFPEASNLNSDIPDRMSLVGVPPPPPVGNEISVSVCDPLAEKIRQLAEANQTRIFPNTFKVKNTEEKRNILEEPRVGTSSHKSASAEDEEIGVLTARRRKRKSGRMFEQARQMLSDSLKKAFRKKKITKEEYKIIMKKGVTALSHRTRLDQQRVDIYAKKYVEYVVRQRRTSH